MTRRTYHYNSEIYHQPPAERDVIMSRTELTRCVLTSYSPTGTHIRTLDDCATTAYYFRLDRVRGRHSRGPYPSIYKTQVGLCHRKVKLTMLTKILPRPPGSPFQTPAPATSTQAPSEMGVSVAIIHFYRSMQSK